MIWPFRRKSKKRMARIVIDEPITSATRVSVLKALKQIEDREFPALIVRIDSPGGTVGDSQEIYSAIKRLKDKGCKVIASFGNISASGGVYIGVASDKIVANPGTITGSIGVIIRGNNLSELLDKIGIKFETVKSGVFKDILSPDKPLSEEGRGLLQGLIDESYKQFTEAVAEGRNLPIDPKIQPLTFGKKKKKILGIIPGSRMIETILNNIFFEFNSSNKVLWLYKP